MPKSSKEIFNTYTDKAFTGQPNVQLNSSTMMDNIQIKQSFQEEKLEGGLADKKTIEDLLNKHYKGTKTSDAILFLKKQLDAGLKKEMEHTKNKNKAKEIAMDHLWEDPKYYQKLKKVENKEATTSGSAGQYSSKLFSDNSSYISKSFSETPKLKKESIDDLSKAETKEATTSGSVGGYVTPSMWAKSTKKKDWGPSRKAQIPGGSFVKVKKKCTKFPYCNQGDINALKISKNESVKEAIDSISKKYGLSKKIIINILEQEYKNLNKRAK